MQSETYTGQPGWLMAYLLHNGPASCSSAARLSHWVTQPKRKRVWTGRLSRWRHTRNRVIYPWAGWSDRNRLRRAELVNVEKLSDDLWVGVKS